jgi:hypothetical protein
MLQAKNKTLVFLFFIFSAMVFQGCPAGTPTTNVNTNTNAANNANSSNANSTNSNTNANSATSAVETKEPDKYTALVKLKFETTGDQKLTMPGEMQATVARSGQDRRMEFNMPNGEKLIYLETGGKNLVIVPNRKQYAELNKETVGFDVRSMMMPAQIVNQVKMMKGVRRVGDEKYADREAVKYEYDAVTETKTQAGNVQTKSYIFVDKETGLPLRSETTSASLSGGYQGIQGLRIVTDMTNIQTNVDQSLFAEPTDFAKVQPDQVKQQIDLVFNVVNLFLQQMLKSAQPAQTNANTNAVQTPQQ